MQENTAHQGSKWVKSRFWNSLFNNHLRPPQRRLHGCRTLNDEFLPGMANARRNHTELTNKSVRRTRLQDEDNNAQANHRVIHDREAVRRDVVSEWKHFETAE